MTSPDKKLTALEWVISVFVFPIAVTIYLLAWFFDWMRNGPRE